MSTKHLTAEITRLTNTINFYAVPNNLAGQAARQAAIARREQLLDELDEVA